MLSRSLYLSMAASVGGMFGFYLLAATVPRYAAVGGGGGLGAGLATGVMMFSTVLLELAVPWLLRGYGYRRVMALGLVLLGAPALALPLSSAVPLVLAICLLRGAGLGILVVVGTVLVADLVPAERRGEGLGVYGVAVGIPSIIGLPLGLWAAEQIGYSPVFLVAGILPLVSLVALVAVPATKPVRPGAGVAGLGGLGAPMAIFGAVTVATGVVMTFLPLAGSPELVSLALLVQSVTTSLTRWWAGRSSDRYGARRLLVPALLAAACGMTLEVWVGNPVAMIAGMALFGAGFGIAQNVTLTLMFERVPRAEFGRVSALWNLAFDAGMGVGAVGFGVVVGHTGYPLGFGLVAILLFATLLPARREAVEPAPAG
jgi:MFS family permease